MSGLFVKKLTTPKLINQSSWMTIRLHSSKFKSVEVTESEEQAPEIPVNPLNKYYTSHLQKDYGDVYDIKPFKMRCIEGKRYYWCSCGHSRSQPICDGTHNNIFMKIKLKPIKFTVSKTKDYWLCNCKQTKNRPFCDGTHSTEEWQIKRY